MKENIIKHIAIIMDGNGRWAKKINKNRFYGHENGAKKVIDVSKCVFNLGVKHLTLFAFSTENWNRPAEEVNMLISLFKSYLDTNLDEFKKNEVKINFIGDLSKFSDDFNFKIKKSIDATKKFNKFNLNIALNYGGRDDILRAVNKIVKNKTNISEITENDINSSLDTKSIPDPDIVIRTSNEYRISNFLLWQMAYSELFFLDKFWPEINSKDIENVVDDFSKRKRRYGKLDA